MKIHFIKSIAMTLICLSLIFLINYLIDPYAIFRHQYMERTTPINERYIKTKFIIENPNKYDSFILGSSRVGTLKGEELNIGNFYNMTFSAAIPAEIYSILKNFEKNNIKIKNIILGIDDFDLYDSPEKNENILYKLSYDKLSKNKFSIYKNYLLINPFNKITYEHFFGKRIANYDINKTGKWNLPYKEIEIEKDPYKHRLNKSFEIPYSSKTNIPRFKKALEDINKIISFCNKKNINLTVIFLPLHKTTYLENDLNNLNEFKKRLQLLTNYWDFAELNKFTEDNYYWYEASHYRPLLGELILKKIFKDNFNIEPKIEDENNIFGKFRKKYI